MLQQILKLSKAAKEKKEVNLTESVKRKKRKQPTDENIYIGVKESASKSKRMKITQVKKENGKGRKKLSTHTSEFQVTNYASPKIWDIFERFQNFNQRKVLTRHKSGLLESCEKEVTNENQQSNSQLDQDKNYNQGDSGKNCLQTVAPPSDDDDKSSMGGDRKRRCVEISDYEDEWKFDGKREPQPVSAFKPKCLNFDDIDES